MGRARQIFNGVVAAIIALLFFGAALLAATSTQHKIRGSEGAHLDAAIKFVREREASIGSIPNREEFETWTQEMDAKGFRFEGYGYTLDKRCSSKASEFCIKFWTGDGFATYKSWQHSMDKVSFDDSPLPLAFVLLFFGLIMAVNSKAMLAPKTSHAGSMVGK